MLLQSLHLILVVVLCLFSIPTFAIALQYFTQNIPYTNTSITFPIYESLLLITIITSFLREPKHKNGWFLCLSIAYGLFGYYLLASCIYNWTLVLDFTTDIVIMLFLSISAFVTSNILFGSMIHMLLTILQFLFFLPTYIHIFTIYSLVNLNKKSTRMAIENKDEYKVVWMLLFSFIYMIFVHFINEKEIILYVLLHISATIGSFYLLGVGIFEIKRLYRYLKETRYLCYNPFPVDNSEPDTISIL
jgi:hypothetical protein